MKKRPFACKTYGGSSLWSSTRSIITYSENQNRDTESVFGDCDGDIIMTEYLPTATNRTMEKQFLDLFYASGISK